MHRYPKRVAAFALLLLALVAVGCGGSSHHSATISLVGLPPTGSPGPAGAIRFGQLAGATPTYILPIVPAADGTSYTTNLFSNLFAPMFPSPQGASPQIDWSRALADRPRFTDGDRTVTITLKRGYEWSDGKPVDAADALFEIALLKAAVSESPANWSQYTAGQFPTSVVSMSAPSKYTFVLKLDRPYNPAYLEQRQLILYPLPSTQWNVAKPGGSHLNFMDPGNAKQIYDFLRGQAKDLSTFATNPLWKIVDGPFALRSFDRADGSYVLAPNGGYRGDPKARATIDVKTYPSAAAQGAALRSGRLDVGSLDPTQFGVIPSLRSKGYSVFGGPLFGWTGATINFENRTGQFDDIIRPLYVRQALAHLIDQPGYVRAIFHGAASANYGPIPRLPTSPYTPADNHSARGPYPYDPSRAAAILAAHGWKVIRGGKTTCARAGSGPGECGAGIAAGTPLKFNWVDLPRSQSPASGLEGRALAAIAKSAAGIEIELQTRSFAYQFANFDDADAAGRSDRDDWGFANSGAYFYDLYPTSAGVFDTHGVFNSGGFSDPGADALIDRSVHGSDPSAVTREGAYLATRLPVLFMPTPDEVYAVSRRVGGEPEGFASLTQGAFQPQFWYRTN